MPKRKKKKFNAAGFWRSISVQKSPEKLKKALAYVKNLFKMSAERKTLLMEQLYSCKQFIEGQISYLGRMNHEQEKIL
ncbi:MAG: hypothetical protein US25_C0054G0004 [Candidatus Moranbacteria bacterium GW2011_GWE1_36_7]|nr:MAG: hypothetical protein UR99_C0061G0004 [Candidatus Moranbacteria bacterium GW2011_GWD2_36_12]KKQ12297.1 MAG: hypothetical protein US25_C0054G0004 [Candidatus Moranbacteria bacterium GW2011_GWE1_36_7]